MVSEVAWNDGTGDKIYLTYTASEGNQTVAVSSDVNTGAARSKVVTFSASGVTPITLTVSQDEAHIPQQYTITLHPTSYDSDHAYYSISNPSNAYNYADNTSYCRVRLTRGSAGAVTYVYFKFDTSSIPEGATIDSVSCSAGIFISNTSSSNVAVRRCQMFTGTTAKGSSTNATTTARVVALSVGTWTREELNDARIRLYAERGTNNVNSDYYFYFYGATLTITYTY